MWEPEGEELQQDQEMGAPRMGTCLENSTPYAQGQREGAEGVLKEVRRTESEGRGVLLSAEGQSTTVGTHEGGAEWGHVQRLLVSGPRGVIEDSMSGSEQRWEVPSILREPRVLQSLGTREGSTTEKPQEQTGVTSVTRTEEQAEVALQDVVKVRAAELCAYSLLSKLTHRQGSSVVIWRPLQPQIHFYWPTQGYYYLKMPFECHTFFSLSQSPPLSVVSQ